MGKTDWRANEARFRKAHNETGIDLETWCAQENLNYHTARRHIKLRKNAQKKVRKTAQKNAQKKLRNSEQPSDDNASQGGGCIPETPPDDDTEKCAESSKTKRIRGSRFSPPTNAFQVNNSAAETHGGYSSRALHSDAIVADACVLTLRDELVFIRGRNLKVAERLGRYEAEMQDASEARKTELEEKTEQAEKAVDRLTARIESLVRTIIFETHTGPKINAETDRMQASAEKTRVETGILNNQSQGSTTPMDEIVKAVQEMENSGLINDYPEDEDDE